MPVISDITARTRTVTFGIKGKSIDAHVKSLQDNNYLKIAPALPILPEAPIPPKLSKRCYNTYSPADSLFNTEHEKSEGSQTVILQWTSEGKTIVATRTALEKERNPDRMCLNRRGLTTFPNIINESRLRLLSLQHNLLTRIENSNFCQLTKLVFLDLYDNQIEKLCNFDLLTNLRVLLIGKNRIRKIEGLKQLSKLEVLDLHGNQIVHISDLNGLISLKVLNLAGNNIKLIGYHDFQGLTSLKELNLKRNKIQKLQGFNEISQLQKLYLSNNDIHKIEDVGSITRAELLKEITIDGNPVTINGDYISFLVSYLPNLQFLSSMPITEQTRKSAMLWRTTKEQSTSSSLHFNTQICKNARRDEVISKAKINWELLHCHPKSSMDCSNGKNCTCNNNVNLEQIHETNKFINIVNAKGFEKVKSKVFGSLTSINENLKTTKPSVKSRSNSSDSLLKLKDATKLCPLQFKLPPVLDSIIDTLINTKLEKKVKKGLTKGKFKSDTDSTLSSDSDTLENEQNLKSCFYSNSHDYHVSPPETNTAVTGKTFYAMETFTPSDIITQSTNNDYDMLKHPESANNNKQYVPKMPTNLNFDIHHGLNNYQSKSSVHSSGYSSLHSKTNSIESCKSALSDFSMSSAAKNVLQKSRNGEKNKSKMKYVQTKRTICHRSNRAATARAKYSATMLANNPPPAQSILKEREQGGDYLIEIVGRCLNVYGQGALRFIDRAWDSLKVEEVNTVKFNYVQFNDVTKVLCKLKDKFPNIEHYTFKETNISYLGQLNALAEAQGLTSIYVDKGNPIISKDWKIYAIFRLAHWGLKKINGKEITNEEIDFANKQYAGLVDIIMCSLPETLLQPLLQRLNLEKVQKQTGEQLTAKQFLLTSDPILRCVVAKEALQWRKGNITQEDLIWRHRGKILLLNYIHVTVDAIQKLQLLENKWSSILHEIIHTTLSDFSDMNTYMKSCSKMFDIDL